MVLPPSPLHGSVRHASACGNPLHDCLRRWAVDLQHSQPLLLMQPPAMCFEELHMDNGIAHSELISDQVLLL